MVRPFCITFTNRIFGDVWLQKHKEKFRAVEVLRKTRLSRFNIEYKRELEVLATFEDKSASWQDDAIIRFFGWFETDDKVCLAMEYFELRDLSIYIPGGEIEESDAKDITINLLEVLKAMHAEGFTYRDIKPQNIFVVTRSPKWWVKIGDFGISKRVLRDRTALRSGVGTFSFMVFSHSALLLPITVRLIRLRKGAGSFV